MRERRQAKADEEEEEKNWASQEEAILRMRSMLEDEQFARTKAMQAEMTAYNKRLAQEKRQREEDWARQQEVDNQLEVTLTNHNEVLEKTGQVRRTDNWQWR